MTPIMPRTFYSLYRRTSENRPIRSSSFLIEWSLGSPKKQLPMTLPLSARYLQNTMYMRIIIRARSPILWYHSSPGWMSSSPAPLTSIVSSTIKYEKRGYGDLWLKWNTTGPRTSSIRTYRGKSALFSNGSVLFRRVRRYAKGGWNKHTSTWWQRGSRSYNRKRGKS
jgi:hypothetical protein